MGYKIVGNAPELRDLVPAKTRDMTAYYCFSSPETLARYAESIPEAVRWNDCAWNSDRSFRGTSNMREAADMADKGWPDGVERVTKLRDRINAAHPTARSYARYDVAGAIPNVQRYLAGNPASMRRIDNAKARRRPVLTLVVNAGANCGVAANALTNRAAVCAAIIDSIEAAGYACHVVATTAFACDSVIGHVMTTIKESHQPADIGRMAYGLGHVSYVRRLNFACVAGDKYCRALGGGLGSPADTPDKSLAENIYVLPSLNHIDGKFRDEESAATVGLEHMLQVLRKQGCPAFPVDETDAA